ncbi:MAG: hypothetical protein ABIT16_01215 [Croceibacterium sp.]
MMQGRTQQISVLAAALALVATSAPAHAQFGGLLRSSRSSEAKPQGCSESKRSTGSRIAGGILGSIAGSAAGRVGGLLNFVPVAAFTDQITASIACRLDPAEQEQAAKATLEATRSDGSAEVEVGTVSAWTSATREDVSGTSTVVARNDDGGGRKCITVSDVIIVSGEETRADKRMCRVPPAVRYALAA